MIIVIPIRERGLLEKTDQQSRRAQLPRAVPMMEYLYFILALYLGTFSVKYNPHWTCAM